jgi:hypothetical protein
MQSIEMRMAWPKKASGLAVVISQISRPNKVISAHGGFGARTLFRPLSSRSNYPSASLLEIPIEKKGSHAIAKMADFDRCLRGVFRMRLTAEVSNSL